MVGMEIATFQMVNCFLTEKVILFITGSASGIMKKRILFFSARLWTEINGAVEKKLLLQIETEY